MTLLYTWVHTPGHHSLLLKLPQMGNVLLCGDQTVTRQLAGATVPTLSRAGLYSLTN